MPVLMDDQEDADAPWPYNGTTDENFEDILLNRYTPIQNWQTRVLRLDRGSSQQPLEADLLVADIVQSNGLVLHDEQKSIDYEAISYTWGQAMFTSSIRCSGHDYKITPTLEAALRQFRLPFKPRYLWADALCIDQTNDHEKSFQVQNMFNIFRKAEKVLVWLDGRGQGLSRMYKSNWVKRVWVQQEIFVARQVEVYAGSEHMSLEEANKPGRWDHSQTGLPIEMAGEDLLHELDKQRYLEGRTTDSTQDVLKCNCMIVHNEGPEPVFFPPEIKQRLNPKMELSFRIECVLHRFRHCLASNPRDHVYGILSMSRCRTTTDSGVAMDGKQLVLPVDYSRSLSQVFQDVTRYIINRDRNLTILLPFAPNQDQLRGQKLPSWTPDWRIFRNHPNEIPHLGTTWAIPWQYDTNDGLLKLLGVRLAEVITVEQPQNIMRWPKLDFEPDPRFPNGPNKVTCFSKWYPEQIFDFGRMEKVDFLPQGWLTEWTCWTIGNALPGDYLALVQGSNWLVLLRPSQRPNTSNARGRYVRYVGAALVCQQDIDVTMEKANWPYPHLLTGIHQRVLHQFQEGMMEEFLVC